MRLLIWKARTDLFVCTVQGGQGRPLLVLVLHVQKHKPLHCSRHEGGEHSRDGTHSSSFYSSCPSSHCPSPSSKTDLLPWTLFLLFTDHLTKHLEMHRHIATHTHTNVVAPVLSEGDCRQLRELRT